MRKQITLEFLKDVGACQDSIQAWHNETDHGTMATLERLIARNQLDWVNWIIVRLMNKRQKVQYTVFAAEQVLEIFEKKYPDDLRPRKAIEAAKEYLKRPSQKTKDAARAAAYAAADAAYAAARAADAAAYAADAAADAADAARAAYAAYAAAYAAYAAYAADAAADAADVARAAAYAAARAAYAAARAADAAADAADAAVLKKILQYGMEILQGSIT